MSLETINNVLSLSKTTRSQRLMLMILAHHADRHGVCWPSIPTLADEMNVAPRNASAILGKLRKNGEVIIVPGGGRKRSNTYLITLGQSPEEIANTLETLPSINPDRIIRVYTWIIRV